MKKVFFFFLIIFFPTHTVWASNYIGEYKCEPTSILTEDFLFIANGKDNIQVLLTKPNPDIELGLVEETKLKKMGMTTKEFQKFKLTQFQKHSFEMKISTNTGQIIQTGQDSEVNTYFENVFLKDGEGNPKLLLGYTEYTSKSETEEYWKVRDDLLIDAMSDILEMTRTYEYKNEIEYKKVLTSLARNMLKNLAFSGSWIEINQGQVRGTLNFSADNAGLLLNNNVEDTEKFRAICKLN